MARFKDTNWNCGDANKVPMVEHAQLAVLMDIRDELKELNRVLNCPSFLRMPRTVERIDSRFKELQKLPQGRKKA